MPIRRRPAGRGAFGSGTSRNGQLLKRRRRPGVPSSWGTLMCLRPALRPRRDRDCQAIAATRHGPTCIQRRGLSTTGNIGARSHGIGARCLRFAVRFTPPHARLASGCPARLYQAGLATRRAPTKGFRDASYIASPFPKLPWRNECPVFPIHVFPIPRPPGRVRPSKSDDQADHAHWGRMINPVIRNSDCITCLQQIVYVAIKVV